jgi:hypothetical protein
VHSPIFILLLLIALLMFVCGRICAIAAVGSLTLNPQLAGAVIGVSLFHEQKQQ